MTIPKLALTFDEAAVACGFSVHTLKDQVEKGNLRGRFANAEGVIKVEDLAQWLEGLPAEPNVSKHQSWAPSNFEKGVISSDPLGGGQKGVGSPTPFANPLFRKPEEIAPELGMTKTELRRYCRESGINTRLSNNRIMLSHEDIVRLLAWVAERQSRKGEWWKEAELERDPFA